MKQTAVEWLYDNLKSHFEHDGDLLEAVQFSFKQAKEMEKQQIEDAYNADRPNIEYFELGEAFEEYYNETYETKEN